MLEPEERVRPGPYLVVDADAASLACACSALAVVGARGGGFAVGDADLFGIGAELAVKAVLGIV